MRFEFSAGGVVYKKENGKIFTLVAKAAVHHGWIFPKGIIGDHKKGEKKEETAVREVKEETGIEAKIIEPLTPVTYWFVFKGERIKKTVYYFLMESLGGNFEERDTEMEEVEWIEDKNVEEKLTFDSDKNVWQEAKKLIK